MRCTKFVNILWGSRACAATPQWYHCNVLYIRTPVQSTPSPYPGRRDKLWQSIKSNFYDLTDRRFGRSRHACGFCANGCNHASAMHAACMVARRETAKHKVYSSVVSVYFIRTRTPTMRWCYANSRFSWHCAKRIVSNPHDEKSVSRTRSRASA